MLWLHSSGRVILLHNKLPDCHLCFCRVSLIMQRGRALDPGMQQLLGISSDHTSSDNHTQHNPLRYDLTEVAGAPGPTHMTL